MVKSDREKRKIHTRLEQALTGLLIAIGFGVLSYYIHSTRQLNPELYEFAARNPGLLVPADCEMRRGMPSVDYVVAQAWRDRGERRYVEACWYPASRFKLQFPIYAAKADRDIRDEQFRKMGFTYRHFTSKAPPLWLLLASCMATVVVLAISMMILFGSRRQIELAPASDPPSAIDAVELRAELAVLRKKLSDGRN